MNFKNRIIVLGSLVVIAGGFGMATVTAHAGQSHETVTAAQTTKTQVSRVKAADHAKPTAKAASASANKHSQKASAASAASLSRATQANASAQAHAASQTAASTKPAAVAAPAQPVKAPAPVAVQTPAQKAAQKAASIRATTGETYVGTVSGLGMATDVIQGSMSRTTAPAQAGLAMTWGGATQLSTTDGLTTEIAGHAKSNTFSWITGLGVGSQVAVTDASGNSRTYRVYAVDDVNDDSYSVKDGKDQYNAIISANQGEAVVLQTCLSDTVNRIVWAR